LYVLVVLVFTVFGFALGVVVFLDSVTNVRGIVCVWTLKGGGGGGLDGAGVVGSGNISPSGNFLAFSDTAHLQSHFFVVLLRSTAGSAPRPGWPARRHSSLVLADLLYLLSPTSLTSKEP
jgi:hypothetical protein